MEKLGVIDNLEYWMDSDGIIFERIPDIREAIRAPKGWKVVNGDFSQAEIRILASISQDRWLMDALKSGKDLHSYMAADTYGARLNFTFEEIDRGRKDENDPRHDEFFAIRNRVKTLIFGIVYGAQKNKIAKLTNLTPEEADELIETFFSKATGLKRWIENQSRVGEQEGFSKSLFNRRRFYAIPNKADENYRQILASISRQCVNAAIQSSCVDMLKLAMKFVQEEIYNHNWTKDICRIFLTVHDELLLLVKEEYSNEAAIMLSDCMGRGFTTVVPDIPSGMNIKDISISDYWKK